MPEKRVKGETGVENISLKSNTGSSSSNIINSEDDDEAEGIPKKAKASF